MRPLSIAAFVLLAQACSRKGPPSAEFAEASAKYTVLYGQKLEDSFTDPRMDEVVDLLNQVPSSSVDKPAADELLKRITDGRSSIAARSAAIQKDLAKLNEPVAPGTFREEPRDRPVAVAAPVDAGVDAGGPNEPVPGMSVSEFKTRWGDCFDSGPLVNVRGVGARDSYLLSGRTRCQAVLPGFADRGVIADGSTILTIAPKSAIMSAEPPPPDRAQAAQAPPPAPPPAPAENTKIPPPSEGVSVPPPSEGTSVPPGTPTESPYQHR